MITKQLVRDESISAYLADIIKIIPKQDYEIKALAYYLISEAIAADPGSEIAILCISTILKDFMAIKNFIRMEALKSVTSIYQKGIDEYVDDMLGKAVKDKSLIVRRVSTVGIYKVD